MLAALVELHGSAAVESIADRLGATIVTVADARLHVVIQLLQAVPRLVDGIPNTQCKRLQRWVEQLPRDGAFGATLREAWSTPFLRAAVRTRLEAMTTADWIAIGGGGPSPDEWKDVALAKLRSAGNYDTANAIIRGLLMPVAESLSCDDLESVVRDAALNDQVRDCFAFPSFLHSQVTARGVSCVVELLQRHDLLTWVKGRVSWLDGVSENGSSEGVAG